MTTIGGPEPHPGPGGSVAYSTVSTVAGCVVVAVVPVGLLHVVGSAGGRAAVDPIRHTLSDYVVAPGGYALLGLSAVALAAAGWWWPPRWPVPVCPARGARPFSW